jgi:hypothetical protein
MGRRCVAALPSTRMRGKFRFLGSVCMTESGSGTNTTSRPAGRWMFGWSRARVTHERQPLHTLDEYISEAASYNS